MERTGEGDDTYSTAEAAQGHTPEQLREKIGKALRLKGGEDFSYRIVRRSLDARRKPELFYVYTVDVSVKGEKALLRK